MWTTNMTCPGPLGKYRKGGGIYRFKSWMLVRLRGLGG